MSPSGPFDMGRGRNGPHASGIPTLGQGRVQAAAPYRIDMSDDDFHAVGDVAVCTLAPPREKSRGGIDLPTQVSPFHLVMAVGPKVSEVLGVLLEEGDTIAVEGAPFADTIAGRVWFVRADKILAVVTKRIHDADTLPPPGEEELVEDENLRDPEAAAEEAAAVEVLRDHADARDEAVAIHVFEGEGGNVAAEPAVKTQPWPPTEPDGAA